MLAVVKAFESYRYIFLTATTLSVLGLMRHSLGL